MCNHEDRKCPRCGAGFACKPGNITQCQCFGIVISEDQKTFIEERYTDCLCRSCLEYLQSEVNRFKEKHSIR